MKEENKIKGLWFFSIVAICYLLLVIIHPQRTIDALQSSLNIIYVILPIIAIIIVFTTLINYFISSKIISKYLGKDAGIKGWLLAAVAGILSHGAVYLWYKFLEDLEKKGMSKGLIAVFLYNRAIKIPLIPIMIHYFSFKFVVVLTFYTIFGSFLLGLIINSLEEKTVSSRSEN